MKICKIVSILSLVAAGSLVVAWAAKLDQRTIKLTGEERYEVVVQDGKVIGGFAQGTHRWDILGGACDGSGLTIVQRREGATDPDKWMTLHFTLSEDQGVLITRMNSEGEARKVRREYRRE